MPTSATYAKQPMSCVLRSGDRRNFASIAFGFAVVNPWIVWMDVPMQQPTGLDTLIRKPSQGSGSSPLTLDFGGLLMSSVNATFAV